MCFSATASFLSSAILVPAGVYTVGFVKKHKAISSGSTNNYTLLALWPVFFGIQQAIEGAVWVGFNLGNDWLVDVCSRSFLFFVNIFWCSYTALSLSLIENNKTRQNILRIFSLLGAIYGMLVYFPTILNPEGMRVIVLFKHIAYSETLPFGSSANTFKLIYGFLTLVPFAIIRNKNINILGFLMFSAALISEAAYTYAFGSVWCFFAALISLFIVYVCRAESLRKKT